LFNKVPEIDARSELCSLIGVLKNPFCYQLFIGSGVGDPSVICATHGQKRFAATAFAALLYCLCRGLG
jgi:hypothetical protein